MGSRSSAKLPPLNIILARIIAMLYKKYRREKIIVGIPDCPPYFGQKLTNA